LGEPMQLSKVMSFKRFGEVAQELEEFCGGFVR
jgi:hypothetical protein